MIFSALLYKFFTIIHYRQGGSLALSFRFIFLNGETNRFVDAISIFDPYAYNNIIGFGKLKNIN